MPFQIQAVAPASTHEWLRFALVPEVSPNKQRQLLQRFGSPGGALRASRKDLEGVLDEPAIRSWLGGPERRLLDAAERWLAGGERHIVGLGDPHYPELWKEIANPPCAFFAEGRAELLNSMCVAIVGSRNATPRGRDDAFEFAKSLSERGICVASGLALGIDASAHHGGLAARGSTVAVMGTGPDRIYPPGNRQLAAEIASRGCLVSEFPPGMPPLERNFPRRNRLISGLARGVLVVEAALPSGSLGTAQAALEQNRDVFAVPGSIHSPLSKGCHWLIKQGAKLVDHVDDVLQELGLEAPRDRAPGLAEEDEILAAIGYAPATMDHIGERTGLDAATLAARLSQLEIEGRIAALAGGWFQRAKKRVIE